MDSRNSTEGFAKKGISWEILSRWPISFCIESVQYQPLPIVGIVHHANFSTKVTYQGMEQNMERHYQYHIRAQRGLHNAGGQFGFYETSTINGFSAGLSGNLDKESMRS